VSGNLLQARDPLGLCGDGSNMSCPEDHPFANATSTATGEGMTADANYSEESGLISVQTAPVPPPAPRRSLRPDPMQVLERDTSIMAGAAIEMVIPPATSTAAGSAGEGTPEPTPLEYAAGLALGVTHGPTMEISEDVVTMFDYRAGDEQTRAIGRNFARVASLGVGVIVGGAIRALRARPPRPGGPDVDPGGGAPQRPIRIGPRWRARSIDDPARGMVRLVAVATAAERVLLPVVARFREHHPEAGVTIQVGNRTTVWDTLRHHEADLVVAGRPPVAVPADTLARGENRLVVIGPASATSRTRNPDALPDPARETWLLRELGSGTRAAADALLAELGIHPPTMILGSNAAIERGVEMGLGVGLISLDAAADRISRGSVKVWACPGTPIDRPWHLVCYSGEPLGPTALALARSMVGPDGSLKATAEGRRLLRG